MSDKTEWAVKHWQGVSTYETEAEARRGLAWHFENYEVNFRNTVPPVLMRRTLPAWTIVEDTA